MFERRFACTFHSIVAGRPRLFILQQAWFPTVFFYITNIIRLCSVAHVITILVDPSQLFIQWIVEQNSDTLVFVSSCALLLESAREFALMFWAAVHLVALFISTAALGCCFRRCFPAAHTIYHQVLDFAQ